MQALTIIQTLTAYNHALFRRLWDSIMQLSDQQFVQEVAYSRGSIRDQMVHVAQTEAGWLRGLRGDPNARRFSVDPADYSTPALARALWEEMAQDLARYVAGLEEADLERQAPGMPGPIWHALVHLANHGTDHRSQILRILNDFGAPTFDQDLVFYLWR